MKALPGSPNESGTGWILTQHREAFPDEVVDRIEIHDPAARPGVNRSDENIKPCMAIHIADGPAGLW